jgi:photosystem II stability/assembly factor-like uncharacterized protein
MYSIRVPRKGSRPFLPGLGILIALLCVIHFAPVTAQEEAWLPLDGPYVAGGTVTSLAVAPSSPDTLYAALGPRIYRSDNAAESWTQVLTATESLWALAVDPASPTVAYAGGSGILYKTDNDGLTWTEVYTMGRGIAIDPIGPANVYAVGRTEGAYTGIGRVAKSTDGGETWTAISLEDTSRLEAIAVHPMTPTILYAGGFPYSGKGSIICKSTDGGLSWTPVYSGYPGGVGIYTIEIDPQHPQTVYASHYNGIVKSDDDGLTWTDVPGLPSNKYSLALDRQHPGIVYAAAGWPDPTSKDVSLYASFDGGQSWWQSVYRFPAAVYALVVDPLVSNVLYAGLQDYGVFKGSNMPGAWAGRGYGIEGMWNEANAGIRSLAAVDTLAVDPAEPDRLYAGSGTGRGGLFRSDNLGATWTTLLTDTSIVSLAINPMTTTAVLAGGPSGVYESRDGGLRWSLEYDNMSVLSLAISPSDPRMVYAGGRVEDDPYYADQGVVAWRVPDPKWGWWHWQEVPIPCAYDISALAIHPDITTTILAGGEGKCSGAQDVVYRSQDGGLSWTEILSDVGYGINSIIFSPRSSDTIYAGGEFFAHKTIDGGQTWERKGSARRGASALTMDGYGWLYVGTWEGVYWSMDGAEQWSLLGTGMEMWVGSLAILPGEPAQLVAGTESGVWIHPLPQHRAIHLPIISRENP